MINRSERSTAAPQSDTTSRRFLRPISSWTNLKSGLISNSSKKSHCDLSITPFPPIDEDVATDFSRYRRSTIHTPFTSFSKIDMIAIETMQPQMNGIDGMNQVLVNANQEAEIMQGSTDSSSVGMAFTTNEETPEEEPNAAFNQQYREQQLAYQRAMQEQQEEIERQAAAARVINTIEKSEDDKQSQIPSQNRVFGLRKDLAGPSTELVNYEHNQQSYTQGLDVQDFSSTSQSSPATSAPPLRPVDSESSTADVAPPNDGPKFSVEVIAPAFDKRGYPVFAGRGARIRGFLRTEALDGHEIIVKLTAAISQGSPAAMWNGVALMPPEQGTERRVFTVEDRIPLNEEMSSLKPGADPSSTNRHDYIYSVPFDLNLPLGVATRWVNGEQKTTAVALPPSYEMSSENDASRREWNRSNGLMKSSGASIKSRSSRMTSFSQHLGTTVKDAVKDGMGEVYRIGCFYKMIFSLQKLAMESEAEPIKRKLGKKKKKPKEEIPKVIDSISVPFIFLGEPTSLPPPPHSIPLRLVPPVLMDSSLNLGDQWDCERNQAKWSGNFFRVAKRLVDLELHMPSPAVLQAPSVFPFILVIRPSDPNLLSTIPSIAPYQEEGTEMNPNRLSSQSPRPGNSRAGRVDEEKSEDSVDQPPGVEFDGILSRFKSSMSLNRKLSQSRLRGKVSSSTLGGGTTIGGHGGGSSGGGGHHHDAESTIGGSSPKSTVLGGRKNYRRPNTAPSMNGSSDGPGGTTVFGAGGRYNGALSGLVRVSLIQSTYCVASGPSEVPKSRRKLISEAEVEEINFETIIEEDGRMYGQARESTLTAIQDAQMKGIRVLRGTFRVGTDATPSFRCQGIEVKYAIKVDLVPFAKKEKRKGLDDPSSGGTIVSSNRSSLNIPSSSSSLHSSSSPPMPPVPLQHRQAVTTQQQNNIRASMGTSSGISSSGQTQGGGGGYAASTAGGTSRYGGGSTIVSESAMSTRLDKGIGALWADVRMVRSAFAN